MKTLNEALVMLTHLLLETARHVLFCVVKKKKQIATRQYFNEQHTMVSLRHFPRGALMWQMLLIAWWSSMVGVLVFYFLFFFFFTHTSSYSFSRTCLSLQ